MDTRTLSAADLRVCTSILRAGSKSFAAAAMLLPARVREPATALYAFCRLADDAVDLGGDSAATLAHLHERLALVYAGQPAPQPVDRSFASVVAQFGIPQQILQALIEGFEWDAAGRSYETLEEVEAYGVRVAGTVGMMMAMLMGVRHATGLARACDLGIAMQLTNIARDVGEDARAGRLYLPRQWLREAGIEPQAFLQAPVFSPALGCVVERLLEAAAMLYQRGKAGIAALPVDCRPAIHGARLIYSGIGHQIAAAGFDSVNRRARVSSQRKVALLAQAMVAAVMPGVPVSAPPAASAHGLIAAVAGEPVRLVHPRQTALPHNLDHKIGRTIELLAHMNTRPRRIVPRRSGRLAAAE